MVVFGTGFSDPSREPRLNIQPGSFPWTWKCGPCNRKMHFIFITSFLFVFCNLTTRDVYKGLVSDPDEGREVGMKLEICYLESSDSGKRSVTHPGYYCRSRHSSRRNSRDARIDFYSSLGRLGVQTFG